MSSSELELELGASDNPSKWRFTWESQCHVPMLRLYLFSPNTKPSIQCKDLKISLAMEKFLLTLSWFENEVEVSLKVPIPRVLVDVDSPVRFRALEDHIETKLALLVPVDHPLVANLHSVLNLSENNEFCGLNAQLDEMQPLEMDSDYRSLSVQEEVHFYCRSCSTKLTRTIRFFEEMPSVNWLEVADNWFGNCCCSFGAVSEKLVTRYAKSFRCATGVCLLDTTSIVLCMDDLLGCNIPEWHKNKKHEAGVTFASQYGVDREILDNGSKHEEMALSENYNRMLHVSDKKLSCMCTCKDEVPAKLEHENVEEINGDSLSCMSSASEVTEDVPSEVAYSGGTKSHDWLCCTLDISKNSLEQQKSETTNDLVENQKSFLNGYLGSIFMARSSCLSKEVHWIEFLCPECSCLLGAYPCNNNYSPLDGGVRLFKCYISTCLPPGGSGDLFRKYTLQRMFTNQLLEGAENELSFRTVIGDLQTKSPLLQIVLLNPNLWCFSDYCLDNVERSDRIHMYPAAKVIFSDCRNGHEFQSRMFDEWIKKNQADEVYMLASQINDLHKALESANTILPPSQTFLPGFSVSLLKR